MTKTFSSNNVPGVRVTTGSLRPKMDAGVDMTEREYRLTAIIIMMTLDVSQSRDTYAGVDVDATSDALQCFGYGPYEARPMVWATLGTIGERYY